MKQGPFIPFDSQPFQAIENSLYEFGAISLNVGVLDPQQQRSALVPGEKPVEQSGPRTSDVEISCG